MNQSTPSTPSTRSRRRDEFQLAARHLEIYATGLKEAYSFRGKWDNAEERIEAIKAEYRELRNLALFLRSFSRSRALKPTTPEAA